jgi:hypothetical protein
MDSEWAVTDDATRQWYKEKCASLRLLKFPSGRVYVYIPDERLAHVSPWREEMGERRLSKIRDRYESDLALGKIDASTSYVDYVDDILVNEPYE